MLSLILADPPDPSMEWIKLSALVGMFLITQALTLWVYIKARRDDRKNYLQQLADQREKEKRAERRKAYVDWYSTFMDLIQVGASSGMAASRADVVFELAALLGRWASATTLVKMLEDDDDRWEMTHDAHLFVIRMYGDTMRPHMVNAPDAIQSMSDSVNKPIQDLKKQDEVF